MFLNLYCLTQSYYRFRFVSYPKKRLQEIKTFLQPFFGAQYFRLITSFPG